MLKSYAYCKKIFEKKTNFAFMKYYLANFSHDLAIAHDMTLYTPPPNVRVMERDLARISDFFAHKGELTYNPYAPVWGWDYTLVSKLRTCGFEGLPTDDDLKTIRRLSSRATAVMVLERIKEMAGGRLPVCGESRVCRSRFELESLSGHFVLKELLSGSGRGLRFVDGKINKQQLNWALRCIRQQGGVDVEPYYEKLADFAFEFIVTDDDVCYKGLSLFQTNDNNSYAGNVIAPQSMLWQRLCHYFSKKVFEAVLNLSLQVLRKEFVGSYLGPLGVDMMIVKSGDGVAIHPCVEVNVRRTMGMMALDLSGLVSESVVADFRLVYKKEQGELLDYCRLLPSASYDGAGKLIGGALCLTPVVEDTHFVALIEVTGDVSEFLRD